MKAGEELMGPVSTMQSSETIMTVGLIITTTIRHEVIVVIMIDINDNNNNEFHFLAQVLHLGCTSLSCKAGLF